jgi:hypothetical protein
LACGNRCRQHGKTINEQDRCGGLAGSSSLDGGVVLYATINAIGYVVEHSRVAKRASSSRRGLMIEALPAVVLIVRARKEPNASTRLNLYVAARNTLLEVIAQRFEERFVISSEFSTINEHRAYEILQGIVHDIDVLTKDKPPFARNKTGGT